MDIRFRGGPEDSTSDNNVSMIFPTRHTGYDNYEGYKNLLDKDFKILTTCSQVIVHIVRELADSKLLPFDIQEYSTALGKAIDHIDGILRNTDLPPIQGMYHLNYYILLNLSIQNRIPCMYKD